MQRAWAPILFTCVACLACGARSEIAGTGDELGDASIDGNAGIDGAGHEPNGGGDASVFDAEACTPAQINIGCAGPPNSPDCEKYGCKFGVEWTCGDTTFSVGGACMPPDAGFASGNGVIEGACRENGSQTSTFTVDTTTCDCKKEQSIVTLVEGLCTHQ